MGRINQRLIPNGFNKSPMVGRVPAVYSAVKTKGKVGGQSTKAINTTATIRCRTIKVVRTATI